MTYTRTRTNNRFLTKNFNLEKIIKASENAALREWQLQYVKDKHVVNFDTKNLVFCADPTLNFRCYYNYMVFLNQIYDYWSTYGLFDQGYKPLIYLPSFWNNSAVSNFLTSMATTAGVNLEKTKGTSLMYAGKAAGPAEYWIYKDELSKLIKFAKQQFKEKFGVDPVGKFDYGTEDPDKVKPTQLIRVQAYIEEIGAKEGGN